MRKSIVMLGSSHDTKRPGGIRSVIEIYRNSGLFDEWPIVYIGTQAWGNHYTKMKIAFRALWQFQKLLAQRKVGLVHAHTSVGASFWRKSLFFLSAFVSNCPTILHLHGGKFEEFYYRRCGPMRRLFISYIFDHVNTIIVLSDGWKDVIGRMTRNQNIVRISNPIAYERESRVKRTDKAQAFLFLGRLEVSKGFRELLQAFAEVNSEFENTELWCGGYVANDLETEVDAAARGGAVKILGWVQGDAKQDLLGRAMAFVLPSYWEGMPISILEAMAVGLPIIATDVGGIPDLVTDRVEGILVQPRNVKALAGAMKQLLESEALREEMGNNAKVKIETQYAAEVIIPQIESIYRNFGIRPVRDSIESS